MPASAGRRAASSGAPRRGCAVTPFVAQEDRVGSLSDWKRAYEGRFLSSSKAHRESNIAEILDQTNAVHSEKLAYFRPRTVPNITHMDLTALTWERSMQQRQPAYSADVGGPPRIGVMPRRLSSSLGARAHNPSFNLGSKAGLCFGT